MIDVVIPFYNAESTLQRAVQSVLNQPELGVLWLVDDGSTDRSLSLAEQFATQFPQKISVVRMPENGGVAKARNWGALQSSANFIAFLDADDAYEMGALQVAKAIFTFQPHTCVVRLALKPVGIAERYASHPQFDTAWHAMQMTGAGNVVFQRAFFLACGGFPQDKLFQRWGGEDGALGIATTQIGNVATAFNEAGVLHFCREGMHAERLLDAVLFNQSPAEITQAEIDEATAVSGRICQQIYQLNASLQSEVGVRPVTLEWD